MTYCSLNTLAIAMGAVVTLTSCTGQDTVGPGVVPVSNNVVFTRADQSRITFASGAKLYAWCSAWEPGLINTPSVHVAFGGPASTDSFWQLTAVVAAVLVGRPLVFPNTFIFDQPKNADIFVSDRSNELSTQAGGSSGSVTFQELTCTSGGAVTFTIAAVIGSELNGSPSVTVSGTFHAPVGSPPQ